jgi:hypothetical protein
MAKSKTPQENAMLPGLLFASPQATLSNGDPRFSEGAAQDPMRHLFAANGALLDEKRRLIDYLATYYNNDPTVGTNIATTSSLECAVHEREALLEAIRTLSNQVFGTGVLTKSHAERLVKALCALIDSKLP